MKVDTTRHLTKGKKFIFGTLLLVFSIILAEIGLQLVYRVSAGQWLWQWWAVPLYVSDDSRVYRVKSNLDYLHKTSEYSARYYTNAQGFRTDRYRKATTIEKPINTYRVMYLGPSFAFGWGVDCEQSYVYEISKNLHTPNKRIESINLGTPAQDMSYQLAWFQTQGYRYAPDLIVQTVYADCCVNLATDGTFPENLPYVEGGYLYTPRPRSVREATYRVIPEYRRYSALLFFGWRLYALLAPSEEKSGTGEELYKDPDGHQICEPSLILEKYRAYERFIQGALGKDIPIIFVYVPLAYIVRPADVVRVRHHGEYKDPLTERAMTGKVQEILNDNGLHFIDLTDTLVQADKTRRMYYLYDIHFTPAGNQVAAATATPIIQKIIDVSLMDKNTIMKAHTPAVRHQSINRDGGSRRS